MQTCICLLFFCCMLRHPIMKLRARKKGGDPNLPLLILKLKELVSWETQCFDQSQLAGEWQNWNFCLLQTKLRSYCRYIIHNYESWIICLTVLIKMFPTFSTLILVAGSYSNWGLTISSILGHLVVDSPVFFYLNNSPLCRSLNSLFSSES